MCTSYPGSIGRLTNRYHSEVDSTPTYLARNATRSRPRWSRLGHQSARRPRSRTSRAGRGCYGAGKELGTPRPQTTNTSDLGKNTPRPGRRRRSTPVAIRREAPLGLERDRPLRAQDPSAWQTPPTAAPTGRAAVSSPTKALPRNPPFQGVCRLPRDDRDEGAPLAHRPVNRIGNTANRTMARSRKTLSPRPRARM